MPLHSSFDTSIITLLFSMGFVLVGLHFLMSFDGNLVTKPSSRHDLGAVDQTTGRQFEMFLARLFTMQGYMVKLTGGLTDMGGDLVLVKDGLRTVVQAKRWRSWVGVDAVRAVVAAKGYYRADLTMVVTNSTFTKNAFILAKANGVTLWDRNLLSAQLGSVDQTMRPSAAKIIAGGSLIALKPLLTLASSLLLLLLAEIVYQFLGDQTSYRK